MEFGCFVEVEGFRQKVRGLGVVILIKQPHTNQHVDQPVAAVRCFVEVEGCWQKVRDRHEQLTISA